jgi:hypothetical protein
VLKKLELKKETDTSIALKYCWLKEKTDKVLEKYKKCYYNEKAKENYPILYGYLDKQAMLEGNANGGIA